MKKLLLSMAIATGFTGSALAADIPAKSPRVMAPAPVVATNWTGCYIAAGGGYGMWNQEHYRASATTRVAITPEATAGGRGWFGTVQAGCDYQLAPRWVVGVFGDYDFSALKGNFNPVGTGLVAEEKLSSSWAVGGRVGYLVLPQLLTYVSGGYTQARFDGVNFLVPGGLAAPTTLSMDAQTYSGWFIGTGYEYALDFLPGLFWKTEYRFSTFHGEDVPLYTVVGGTRTLTEYIHAEKYVHAVRSELVWRFNWGGPVVARY